MGDLYQPDEAASHPRSLRVHGGGFQLGSRDFLSTSRIFLAAHGYVLFRIDYRLTRDGDNRDPAAVKEVRTAVQWLRSQAAELKIDPARSR